MSARITQQQLESYLWGAATLLRGTIDAGDYKQFIFPLLFYKRLCDVFDEETRTALAESDGDEQFSLFPENHRFQIPSEAHWRRVRQTATDVGRVLQNALRAIEIANPDKLYGIFGDAQWTNKDRLSDAMLRDLVEHFSALELTVANLPEDELGQGYEYLIKKFADDSGHTAAEFYTNRTVVHLMAEMLQPQPGESIYDPTCGSGGMLLSAIAHLRRHGQEWRNVRLYGQERNLMTSSIARMNCFLHGIEDFRIERGDTLAEPKLVQGDCLMRFDVVLANPPYSIKQWDRDTFASDPWGRNLYGTPPQGRADYAFWQHILQSLAPKTGRCAILFPHGVLFRQEEADMRRKLIEADVVECVLGLGPNLFYNSPMEACVVICRTAKVKERRNKILFINAVNEVTRERAQSFLMDDHIARIVKAYETFTDEPGFTRVVGLEEIRKHYFNINIPLYVTNTEHRRTAMRTTDSSLDGAFSVWLTRAGDLREALSGILGNGTSAEPLPNTHNMVLREPMWLDRSKWQTFRFDQIAENLRESVMPTPDDSATYIGLEHMDTGSLHVRRWGSEADLIGQKLRMRKGDILFARRNAYLRRVAIAPHDGLFSAHGMILRPKPDVVLSEFLPLLMMSDRFMNRAVEISVGSLSPTINWSTLKLEEFAISPLDQQRRIAEILWTVDDYKLALEEARIDFQKAYNVFANERVAEAPYPLTKLGDLSRSKKLDIQTGPFGTVLQASSYVKEGTPIVNPVNMIKRRLCVQEGPYLNQKECERLSRYRMKVGDILVGRKGDVGRAVLVVPEYEGFIVGSDLIRLRLLNADIQPDYLYFFLLAPRTRLWIARHASGTTMPGINEKLINGMQIPVPPRSEQTKIVREFENLNQTDEVLLEAISVSANLLLSFANRLVDEL